jgi:hypothetical protein
MLDLIVATDLIRERTSNSVAAAPAAATTARRPARHRPGPLRTRSAAALRGLANRLDRPPAGAVAC